MCDADNHCVSEKCGAGAKCAPAEEGGSCLDLSDCFDDATACEAGKCIQVIPTSEPTNEPTNKPTFLPGAPTPPPSTEEPTEQPTVKVALISLPQIGG